MQLGPPDGKFYKADEVAPPPNPQLTAYTQPTASRGLHPAARSPHPAPCSLHPAACTTEHTRSYSAMHRSACTPHPCTPAPLHPVQVVLSPGPMFHIYPLTIGLLFHLWRGTPYVYMSGPFSVARFCAVVSAQVRPPLTRSVFSHALSFHTLCLFTLPVPFHAACPLPHCLPPSTLPAPFHAVYRRSTRYETAPYARAARDARAHLSADRRDARQVGRGDTCMHVCTCTYMHKCTCTWTRARCACARVCARVRACVRACMRVAGPTRNRRDTACPLPRWM